MASLHFLRLAVFLQVLLAVSAARAEFLNPARTIGETGRIQTTFLGMGTFDDSVSYGGGTAWQNSTIEPENIIVTSAGASSPGGLTVKSTVHVAIRVAEPTDYLVEFAKTGNAAAHYGVFHTVPGDLIPQPYYIASSIVDTTEVFRLEPNITYSLNMVIGFGSGSGSGSGDLSFSVSPFTYGDFDGDGDVDGADFVAWQTNFPMSEGATLADGDADLDGDVDGADFVVWQTNFAPSGVQAVPEPAGVWLALLFLAGAILLSYGNKIPYPRTVGKTTPPH